MTDQDPVIDAPEADLTTEAAPEKLEQKVTVEDLGPARKKLIIEVPQERIAAAIETSFGKLKSDAAIPGFRRGRVPQRLLERRFGQSVRDDIRGQIVSESYHQALEDNEIRVLGEPDVDMEKIELPESGPLKFEVEVEVAPKVELPDLDNIPVGKTPVEISDKDLDEEIERFQDRFGDMVEAEAGAKIKADDYLTTQVTISGADGDEIANLSEANIVVAGESRQFKGHVAGIVVDDLGKQLAGKKVGDDLTLTLVGPATHENEQIRDKPITITIKIDKIQRIEPAPIETLVQQFGEESEESFRNHIRENLAERGEREQQAKLHEQITEYLLEKVDLELPPGITSRQAERLVHREMMDLAYRGVPQEEIDQQVAELRSGSEEEARKQLKAYFVLEAAAQQLEVEVGENEINGRIAMLAMQQGRRPEKVRQEMHRSGELEHLYLQMREQKTLDAILAKAKVSEVAAAADDEGKGKKSKAPAKTTKKKTTKKKKSEE